MMALVSTLASLRMVASARVSLRIAVHGPALQHTWQLGLRPARVTWPRMTASSAGGGQHPDEPEEKATKGDCLADLVGNWEFDDHPNPLTSFDVVATTKELDCEVKSLCSCDIGKHQYAVAKAFDSPVADIAVVRAPSAVWRGCTG